MTSPDKKTILWLSDGPQICTGYSTQSLNIMNHAADNYNTHFLAHTHGGLTLKPGVEFEDGLKLKFWLHGNGREPYCKDIMTHKIMQTKADIFGILLDTFMLYPWFLDVDTVHAKTLFYFPSDGGWMPNGCENILRKVHYPVAMSKFARKQVKDYYDINTGYIPHGVDCASYFPFSEEQKQTKKAQRGLADKFVVGVVQRNQGRKFPDRLLKTFAMFAQEHKDAFLLMHTDPYDPAAPVNLLNLIARYGLQNRVGFTGMRYFAPFTYAQMNEVYNLMDVFFMSTSGEGFGIPIIEAQAAGVPQVVTDYTTSYELIHEEEKSGEVAKLVAIGEGFSEMMDKKIDMKEIDYKMNAGTLTGSWDVERGFMDNYDALEKLNRIYNNRSLLKQYAANGRKKVEKYFDWKVVLPQWNKQFEMMLE